MKIYSGGRQNGKTTKLIIDAELHDRVILVRDRQRAKNIENMARAMGRSIRQPITLEDLKRTRLAGSFVRKLLIDDAETVLQGMITEYTGGRGIVDGITITTWEPLEERPQYVIKVKTAVDAQKIADELKRQTALGVVLPEEFEIKRLDGSVREWIPITTRPAKEKEKEEAEEFWGYPCDRIYNCKLPNDGQVVLITTIWGEVSMDVYVEDGCYFEDHEDMDDVLAWMPLPRAYEKGAEP